MLVWIVVRLALEPGLPCSLEATLPAALTAQGMAVAPDARWVLTARRVGDAVEVRLGADHARRFSPGPADCPVLARAVALLVRSWVDAAPPPAAAPTPAPVVKAGPVGRPPAPAEPVVAEPEPVVAEPEPATAPPLIDAAPVPIPAARAFEAAPAHALGARVRRSLSVLLTGGATVAVADQPVGLARLAVEWGVREPWALAVDAGFQSLRGTGTADGTVRASLQWAGLSGRRAFATPSRADVHVLLGGQLIRFDAVAVGFSTRRRADVFTAGATLALDLRVPLAAGLFALARLTFQARVPQSFSIDGVGPVLTVPAWGLGLEAGLGWNFL